MIMLFDAMFAGRRLTVLDTKSSNRTDEFWKAEDNLNSKLIWTSAAMPQLELSRENG